MTLRHGGDPVALANLVPMDGDQRAALPMVGNAPTLLRMARATIVAQQREIIQLRKMLQHDGLNKPEYGRFDRLISLRAVE